MSLSADDVMTSAQVAKLLNETVKNVEAWARADVLPGFKLGRRWKFLRSDIEEVLRDARRRRRLDQVRDSTNSLLRGRS